MNESWKKLVWSLFPRWLKGLVYFSFRDDWKGLTKLMLGYSMFLLEARRLMAEADGTSLWHEGNPHDKVKWSLQLRNQTKGERILKADGSLISDGNQTFYGLEPILHFSFADRLHKNHWRTIYLPFMPDQQCLRLKAAVWALKRRVEAYCWPKLHTFRWKLVC